jgi:hypothetical protein
MKVRSNLVSNSSTSSFTCDICNETYSGWDALAYMSKFDCFECENGHIGCNEHLVNDPENAEWNEDEGRDGAEDKEGNLLALYCPICQFTVLDMSDASSYLEKETGITREEVFAEVKKINKRRKVLRDYEYVQHVCQQRGIDENAILAEMKARFEGYDKFLEYIGGRRW